MGGTITSEIRKVFTTRLWWGMLIGVAIIGAGLAALFAAQVGTDAAQHSEDDGGGMILARPSPQAAQLVYSAGFTTLSLAALFPLALGVVLITSEFRHQTWTATVLAQPRRWPIVPSKIVAIAAVALVYAVVYTASALLGGGLVLTLAKDSSLYLTDGHVLQTIALLVLAFVLWTLLGFGFGLLMRNQLAAVLIAVGLAFVGNIVFQIVFGLLGWATAARLLPNTLTTGMLNPSLHDANPDATFAWWVCALVLAAYALGITALGAVLNQRRDIT